MVKNNKSNNNFKGGAGISRSLLYNRPLLYIVFLIAIGNIYYLVMDNDLFTLVIFVVVAFLTTFFSKNMVVVLCISLAISAIVKYGSSGVQVSEGLSDEHKETIDYTLNSIANIIKDKKDSKLEGVVSGSDDAEDESEPKQKDNKKKDGKSEQKENADNFDVIPAKKVNGNSVSESFSVY
jgi:hypothetical protein